jgi:hypothetical protein
MKTGKGFFLIVSLLATTFISGQVRPSVEVSVEKNRVLLGEPFRLRIQLQLPEGSKGQLPVIDSIPHFEFTQPPVIDSSEEKGAKNIKAVYYLSSFDSGHWVIPSFRISREVKSDTIGVDVVFSEFDKEQPYHDIKDIIEVKPATKKNWWWLAGGGLFALLIIIYLLTRKKRKGPAPAGPTADVDPFREALNDLEKLKQSAIGEKEYYTKLTDILRRYLLRRKGILSLQETTSDLIPLLKNTGISENEVYGLRQTLLLSDFVKFAKYQPSTAENQASYDEIGKAIRSIERLHEQSVIPKEGTGGQS